MADYVSRELINLQSPEDDGHTIITRCNVLQHHIPPAPHLASPFGVGPTLRQLTLKRRMLLTGALPEQCACCLPARRYIGERSASRGDAERPARVI